VDPMEITMKDVPQVSANHYVARRYDAKERFASYWHQIDEIVKLQPRTVLEIGIGTGLLSWSLRKRGINVTTIDIAADLQPDCVGSIVRLPFATSSFDVIACFQVLEHLRFEVFLQAVQEIQRVAKSSAVISLPDVSRIYRLFLQFPRLGEFRKFISVPYLKPPEHRFDGEHWWEIGRAGFPLKRVEQQIAVSGFRIETSYRVFEHPYHRFFILRKHGAVELE